MSTLRAANNAAVALFGTVTTTAVAATRTINGLDKASQVFESNADLWATKALVRNKALKAQAQSDAIIEFRRTATEKAAELRTWLAQDPQRQADWDATAEVAAKLFA